VSVEAGAARRPHFLTLDPEPEATAGDRRVRVTLARGGRNPALTGRRCKEPFKPEVFAQEEEKMQRKKLARLHHLATALNYHLVPNQ